MKRKIFITFAALALLILGSSFVSAQVNDAELEFRPSVLFANVGEEFDIDVYVKNPGEQSIISVRSWIGYNANALEAVNITTDESLFTLSAPGEDNFAPEEGRVKLGRSNITGGVTDLETKVATVRFRVKTPYKTTAKFSPYDYQVTELGHVSVNIIDQGFPINILTEEPEEVTIQLNPDGQSASSETVIPDESVVIQDIGGNGVANLLRPQNLMANTGFGYVDLKWDVSNEAELMGYNIYYGKTSGQYARRKTVGRVDRYRIEGLNNGEAYYFAVTAYDSINRESDYSDEVGIIVNEPLSSTSPFAEIVSLLLAKLPAQPQNGPLVGWLVFSAAGLGGTIMFRKKRS